MTNQCSREANKQRLEAHQPRGKPTNHASPAAQPSPPAAEEEARATGSTQVLAPGAARKVALYRLHIHRQLADALAGIQHVEHARLAAQRAHRCRIVHPAWGQEDGGGRGCSALDGFALCKCSSSSLPFHRKPSAQEIWCSSQHLHHATAAEPELVGTCEMVTSTGLGLLPSMCSSAAVSMSPSGVSGTTSRLMSVRLRWWGIPMQLLNVCLDGK